MNGADDMLRRRLADRLRGSSPALQADDARFAGVDPADWPALRRLMPATLAPAAVLMPIVERPSGLSLLLTRRASALRRHAGQISFPGGRIEPQDAGPLAAALRETEEEIGLPATRVDVAGYLRPQLIITGYWVVPVVGFVAPGFTLHPDPEEVQETFEVPLAHVLDPTQHIRRRRDVGPVTITTTEIAWDGRVIWGATAAMLVALAQLLDGTEASP